MYKKLFGIFIVAVLLIISAGVISATDSISVKVVWQGDVTADSVTVDLIKDGRVVDRAKLSSDNLWSTTFKVDDNGNYHVNVSSSSHYHSTVSGDASSGFIIKNTVVKEDALSSNVNKTLLGKSLKDDKMSQDLHPVLMGNETADTNSSNEKNATGEVNETDNTAVNTTGNASGKATSSDDSNKTTTKTKVTTTKTTKVVKSESNKKPVNKTKSKQNNTGLPLAVLVCAVFIVAFIPITRKK